MIIRCGLVTLTHNRQTDKHFSTGYGLCMDDNFEKLLVYKIKCKLVLKPFLLGVTCSNFTPFVCIVCG